MKYKEKEKMRETALQLYLQEKIPLKYQKELEHQEIIITKHINE